MVISTSPAARTELISRLEVNWLLTAPLICVAPPRNEPPVTAIGGDPLPRTLTAWTPRAGSAASRSPIGRSCIRLLPVIVVTPEAWPAMEIRKRSGVPAPPMKISCDGARMGSPVGVTWMTSPTSSMSTRTCPRASIPREKYTVSSETSAFSSVVSCPDSDAIARYRFV